MKKTLGPFFERERIPVLSSGEVDLRAVRQLAAEKTLD